MSKARVGPLHPFLGSFYTRRAGVNEKGKINIQNLYIPLINIIQGVLGARSCQAFRAKMLEIPEPN